MFGIDRYHSYKINAVEQVVAKNMLLEKEIIISNITRELDKCFIFRLEWEELTGDLAPCPEKNGGEEDAQGQMTAYQDHQQEKELATLLKSLEKPGLFKKCPSVTGIYAARTKILFHTELDTCKS